MLRSLKKKMGALTGALERKSWLTACVASLHGPGRGARVPANVSRSIECEWLKEAGHQGRCLTLYQTDLGSRVGLERSVSFNSSALDDALNLEQNF